MFIYYIKYTTQTYFIFYDAFNLQNSTFYYIQNIHYIFLIVAHELFYRQFYQKQEELFKRLSQIKTSFHESIIEYRLKI